MKQTQIKKNQIGQVSTFEKQTAASIKNALMFVRMKRKLALTSIPKTKPDNILFISLVIFSLVIFSSCSSPAEKVENAHENVTQANEDLYNAQEEYEADVELFRMEIADEIANNEANIADIRLKIKNSKSANRAEYERQILVLEKMNIELKQKMIDYKADKNNDWQTFKTKFKSDLDELGLALKNFVTDEK